MLIFLAAGLKYLHARGIIHRDLKPANILITGNLLLKIADFGFARKSNTIDLYTSLVGTPLYMAPEVYKSNYSSKCDIWSAGVIFYEMLTGTDFSYFSFFLFFYLSFLWFSLSVAVLLFPLLCLFRNIYLFTLFHCSF